MKAYRVYLANGEYFGTFQFYVADLRRLGATVKGNVARFK